MCIVLWFYLFYFVRYVNLSFDVTRVPIKLFLVLSFSLAVDHSAATATSPPECLHAVRDSQNAQRLAHVLQDGDVSRPCGYQYYKEHQHRRATISLTTLDGLASRCQCVDV